MANLLYIFDEYNGTKVISQSIKLIELAKFLAKKPAILYAIHKKYIGGKQNGI